ncbi:ribosome-recycling factor [Roseivirga seohaensis subsp. aquiponti]|uniref:Ribosome-recycling factor n=1 Tax=Roseivirga seohaensis subsp. aquiponti TaxID=1566026 RepID=A0A0L8AM92_9BACT|nr:ribosome recycling factor [Roseivirga seohaensis]KOF03583.1 ribosome-recycling factor [Roseivirga seohaensis subsp. aquiponti]
MEELELYLDTAKEMMEKAISHTKQELAKIRAGKAMPSMLDVIKVDYYGSLTPLNQVASVTSPDARTLFVKPWEKSMTTAIEKAIMNSDLGLNPQNDGEQIIINIPQLTEERRRDLVKQSKAVTEDGKISIRSARKETNDELKKLQKDGLAEDLVKTAEDKVQDLTNTYNKKLDDLLAHKEQEIMTI